MDGSFGLKEPAYTVKTSRARRRSRSINHSTFQIVVDRSQPLISKADFVEGLIMETLEKYSPTSRFRRDNLDALIWEVSLDHWKSS